VKYATWLVAAYMCFAIGSAQAQPARNPDIETVIQKQMEAFQADDFQAAFEYATPAIQKRFGSAERFGFVVIHRYPMVWRPAEVQYIGVEQYASYTLQKVMVTDLNKTLHILVYEMVPVGQGWRIGSVQILRQPKSDT